MRGLAAAVGMFDGVHLGHQALVGDVCCHAAAHPGLVPAAFTFARHPLQVVKPEVAPPLLTGVDERCCLLHEAGAEQVEVLDFDEKMRRLSAREFLRMIRDAYGVRLLVVGFNHRFGCDRIEGLEGYQAIGRQEGIEVVGCRHEVLAASGAPVSSSAIRRALLSCDVAGANAMLGRRYSISGTVGHGQEVGRTIGWPTANLEPAVEGQLVPGTGAYACLAHAEGAEWPAMVNIGCRPTLASGLPRTIEAHLIGYHGELYGKSLRLEFAAYLRPEMKFASLDQLRRQLGADAQAAIENLK